MLFGERFYNMCTAKGCKPNTIVKSIGLSTATATKWKNSAIPNGEALTKIADYIDYSIDYLLGRIESPECSDNHKSNYVSNVNSDNNTISNTLSQNYGTQIAGGSAPASLSPSDECTELMRIYTALPFQQRVRPLNLAVELEQES